MEDLVIGIDPALRNVGIAVVKVESKQPVFIERMKFRKGTTEQERYRKVAKKLDKIVSWYYVQLKAVIIESILFAKNSAKLAERMQLIGMLKWVFYNHGIPVYTLMPNQVKLVVAGKGNATKDELREVLKHRFGLEFKKTESDMADAFAVAVAGIEKFL